MSPEGTRSRTGRLADFKKGAFHTALQVRVPVTPLLLDGAHELWPTGSIFVRPGVVRVSFLRPIAIAAGETHTALASRVRRAFLQHVLQTAQEEEGTAAAESSSSAEGAKSGATQGGKTEDYTVQAFWLPLTYLVLYLFYRICAEILSIFF